MSHPAIRGQVFDLPDLTPKDNIQGYQRDGLNLEFVPEKAPNTSSVSPNYKMGEHNYRHESSVSW